MDARLLSLLDRVGRDHVSGASETARYVAVGLREHLGRSADKDQLRDFAFAAYASRRAMAPLFGLLNQLLLDLDLGDEVWANAAREHLSDFIESEDSADAMISEGFESLGTSGDVLTISNSSTVARALTDSLERSSRRAIVMASRPGEEGKVLARRLSESGIECLLISDSMVFDAAKRCGVAVCGADCVVPGFLVNKVGTAVLALTCRKAGIPLYALCSTAKFVGVDISDPIATERKKDGYRVRYQVFERIPLNLIPAIVTEKGKLATKQIKFSVGRFPLLEERR